MTHSIYIKRIVTYGLIIILSGFTLYHLFQNIKIDFSSYPSFENNVNINNSLNYIIILTDDQYYKTLEYMPLLKKHARSNGIIFENAFVTNPECCPFRASLLSGGFHTHDTGVKTNDQENGSISRFNDNYTLATWLQLAGYTTGFIGKYMHGYKPGYVPPGWSYFVANEKGGALTDWFKLKNITYGSSNKKYEKGIIRNQSKPHEQYVTEFQRDKALEFINKYSNKPFFLFLSLYSPHTPATPATKSDVDSFPNAKLNCIRDPDYSDKPLWVRILKNKRIQNHCGNKFFKKSIDALQSVDRMINDIFTTVNNKNISDKTVIFFLSDNGINLGVDFGYKDKGIPYDGSIRVPMIIYYPNSPLRSSRELVAANLDIGATIFDSVGILDASDGKSLIPLLQGENNSLREEILIENYGYLKWHKQRKGDPIPTIIWSGLRTKDWKYIEYTTGEKELYNMQEDPYELNNLINIDSHQKTITNLSNKLNKMKGLTIVSTDIPDAIVGIHYEFKLEAWGGKLPYKWYIQKGELPKGLLFDPKNGIIEGEPTESGEFIVHFKVVDSGKSKHSRKEQEFNWPIKINVSAN